MKRALIAANGELPAKSLLEALQRSSDLFVCADGAANSLREIGLTPDVIIGDLDSITHESLEFYSERSAIVEERDQETTDLEKALRYCVAHDVRTAMVVGVSGKRLDHTISNLSTLEKYSSQLSIEVREPQSIGIFLRASANANSVRLPSRAGESVSLIAFRKVEGIITSGLRYPLTEESLEWATRIGQSNCADRDHPEITIRTGALLIFYEARPAA